MGKFGFNIVFTDVDERRNKLNEKIQIILTIFGGMIMQLKWKLPNRLENLYLHTAIEKHFKLKTPCYENMIDPAH